MTAPSPAAVERVARAAHERKIALCWGQNVVGIREPWPDFDDPVVKRAYPHTPIAYVDIAMAQARAALAAYHAQLDAEGLVIVPRHPTTAMQGAAAALPSCKTCGGFGDDIHQNDIWRAMADAYEPPGGSE